MNEKTGYPHIDRPWMEFYDKKGISDDVPELKIVDYIKEKNKGNEDRIAIDYYGKKIEYGNLYDNIDQAAKVLSALGVKENERILFLAPNIPETAYLMYGASKIGAVCDFIDPRPDTIDLMTSAKKTYELILEEKIDHIVSLDLCYLGMLKPLENELKNIGIKNILLLSAEDSMDLVSKFNYLRQYRYLNDARLADLLKVMLQQKKMSDMVKKAKNSSIIELIDFANIVRDCRFFEAPIAKYNPERLAVITHTSGTSGKPKPIPLTDENLNAYNEQTYLANIPVNVGDRAIHMLPYFAAYGLVNVLHAGFCHGNELIEVPEFKPTDFGKLVVETKPNIIIGAPTWILSLLKDPSLTKEDLSYLKMLTYGGDTLSIKDEIDINNFLQEHGASIKVTKGHGMSEMSGCCSFAVGEYNNLGGLGIPMPSTIYGVVDPDTKKPIRFADDETPIIGELIISSKAETSGVLDGKCYVPKIEIDGREYILTNDIARMYPDGKMEFLSRNDRAFTRYDGYKVKTYEVEKMIRNNENVRDCIIIPYVDETKFGGNNVMAVIICDRDFSCEEEKIEVAKSIVNDEFINNKNASIRQIPAKIRFVDEFPLTPNGKVDYKHLYENTQEFGEVDVTLNETNMSIESISFTSEQTPKIKKIIK